jgi:hypothetical protein
LTPTEIDSVLAAFRVWLEQCANVADVEPTEELDRPVDLAAIVDAFTALRHEVHLQTRAARTQAEQTAAALAQTNSAIERQAGSNMAPAPDQRELLENLIEAADVLARAHAGLQRSIAATQLRGGWRSWFGGGSGEEAAIRATAEGLTLGLQRFERLLEHHGLAAIPAVGKSFDADTMEVVDVVCVDGYQPGVVVEEVQRGYRRDDALFRHALVNVSGPARSQGGRSL